jgi:hypothetical protein
VRAEDAGSGLAGRSRLVRFVLDRARRLEAPGALPAPRYFAGLYAEPESWSIVADAFAGFGRLSRERELPILVLIFPYLDDLERYQYAPLHRQVAGAARANGLEVLDLYPAFRPHGAAALRLSRSDTHPNRRAHGIAAERLQAWIRSRDAREPAGTADGS